MLIVLEGLDGAGKSTQVRRLEKYLRGVTPALEYIHFPRYDSPVYGNLIGKFLRGDFGSMETVHPQLVALLFAEDRHNAAADIRKVLSDGGVVLLDRYVYSNVAYQCAKLSDPVEAEELRNWILRTEFVDFGIPRPDINIFLDVPIDFVESRLSESRNGDDRSYLEGANDIHEADIEFQKRVRSMYRREAEENPELKVVDCSDADGHMLPAGEIFQKIKTIVDEYV